MEFPFVITDPQFSTDFKTALGFVDIDIPILKIKPDLRSAAQELAKIIGQPTYDALIANYQLNIQGAPGAAAPYQNVDLTEAFRYAMATMAYAIFAPSNDLGHTPNGRKMRSSDDQKTPFEWMMVRDDDKLQRRSYRAIDALIEYMDANFAAWQDSDVFEATHKTFIRSLDDFTAFYALSSRLLFIKLQPGLNISEKREIEPRIGAELYESLKAKVLYYAKNAVPAPEDPNFISANEEKLLGYIKEASAYYALYWGIPRLQINLFPEGILQSVRSDTTTIKARQVPSNLEVDQVSKLFKQDCDRALHEIEELYLLMFPPVIDEEEAAEDEADKYGYSTDDNFVTT